MSSPAEDEVSTAWDSGHRTFLQAFLAHQVLTFEQAKPLLAKVLSIRDRQELSPEDISLEEFESFIATLNRRIESFSYEIRSAYSQHAPVRSREKRLYCLVNTTSDPQTQLATSHSPDEIAFVKRVLDLMFDSRNKQSREVMAAQGMEALRVHKASRDSTVSVTTDGNDIEMTDGAGAAIRLPQQSQAASNVTMKQAEDMLESLIEEGWLELSAAGYYSLTPRALLELGGWLEETYNDPDAEDGDWQRIKKCEACKEIVTAGQRCVDADCNCRLHDFCARGLIGSRGDSRCPRCQKPWTGENYVGERAARGYQPGRTSNASKRKNRREPYDSDDD